MPAPSPAPLVTDRGDIHDDLTQGRDLTDDALAEALRARHAAKRVYTYAG